MRESEYDRDCRIVIEKQIAAEAHRVEERATSWFHARILAWHAYMEDRIHFPFAATCISRYASSPLRIQDRVEVIGLADESRCEYDLFVEIRWHDQGRTKGTGAYPSH